MFDDFCREWARAEVVGNDKISMMMQKDADTKRKKSNARGSNNAERNQLTNRDLTDEFQTVDVSEGTGA